MMPDREIPEDMASLRAAWMSSVDANATLERKLTEQRLHGEQLQLLGSAVRVTGQASRFSHRSWR